MKRRILILLAAFIFIGTTYSQACIDTVANGLTVLNKFNFNGPDCLFSVKFCVRKTTAEANVIEYAVYSTGQEIFDSIDVSGYSVGSVICRIFTFVADCNSTASFVAVGRKVNKSICGVVADLIVLPIRLLSFSGETQKSGVVDLKWETATESNSSHFILQQSKDGKSFLDLAKIKAAGESSLLQSYSYQTKPNTTTASSLFSYYRLKMVDRDNSFTYSQIISVGKNSTHKIQVYPNPSSNFLKINKTDLLNGELRMSNLQGQEMSLAWLNENTLDIRDLNSGLYLIKYQNEVIRFIKE